jgi:hypothetical protein
VFWFAARAINLVFAYQPNPISGTAFAAIAIIGAAGAVLLFLALCYTAAVGGVYLLAKQAAAARIEAQQRAQYIRGQAGGAGGPYGRRAHYD